MEKETKAVVYLRVSTDRQDYARQLAELKREAEYRRWTIVKVIDDKETGQHDDRDGFLELTSMTKDDIDVVMIWEVSRLTRKLITTLQTIDEFSKQGIAVYAKKENIITLDEDGRENPSTKLALVLLGQMAETELTNIRERMLSGKRYAVLNNKSAYTSSLPYGYSKENGHLIIVEEEAVKIREMYNMRISGMSLYQIAAVTGWSAHCIRLRIRNEVYKGRAFSKLINEYVDTPAIVSEEIWDKANGTMSRRQAKPVNPDGLLRRKIKCPDCGNSFSLGKFRGAGGKQILSYRCTNTAVKHHHSISLGADKLHGMLQKLHTSLLGRHKDKDKENAARRESERIRSQMEAAVAEASMEIKRIEALVGIETPKQIEKRRSKVIRLNAEIKNLALMAATVARTVTDQEKTLWYDDIVKIDVEYVSHAVKKLTIYWITGLITSVLYRPRKNEWQII